MTTEQRWERSAYRAGEMFLFPAKQEARGSRKDPPAGYFGGITALWTAQPQTSGLQTEEESMGAVLRLQPVAAQSRDLTQGRASLITSKSLSKLPAGKLRQL